jgi:hypothetical protein
MVVRIGGIRKFTFDVSNKNGTALREFRRDDVFEKAYQYTEMYY